MVPRTTRAKTTAARRSHHFRFTGEAITGKSKRWTHLLARSAVPAGPRRTASFLSTVVTSVSPRWAPGDCMPISLTYFERRLKSSGR
jgi:hypothetical protein